MKQAYGMGSVHDVFGSIVKAFTTARKSILKLVKLESLMTKCCKIRKI